MNKRLVVEKIIARLKCDLEILCKAARNSHAEATHESSKAENKYDTRGLEASYLADGQVRQAEETEQTILQFQSLPLIEFKPTDLITVGALVTLENKRDKALYFIGPRGGGVEVEVDGQEIVVLTLQAPLGKLLVGRKAHDRFKMGEGRGAVEYGVTSVK